MVYYNNSDYYYYFILHLWLYNTIHYHRKSCIIFCFITKTLSIPVRQSCLVHPCTHVQFSGAVHSLFTPQPPVHIAKMTWQYFTLLVQLCCAVYYVECTTMQLAIYQLMLTHCSTCQAVLPSPSLHTCTVLRSSTLFICATPSSANC